MITDNQSYQSPSQEWAKLLNQAGYRVTKPRRAILQVIADSPRPLAPLEIHELASQQYAQVGLVTVYRTIDKMEELGLIERVHHFGHCQKIFRATNRHQHLLICAQCGRSTYFDGLEAEEQFRQIGEKFGYDVTRHWLQLSGVCPDCQKQKNNPQDTNE